MESNQPKPLEENFSFRLLDGGREVIVFGSAHEELARVKIPGGNAVDHPMANSLADGSNNARQFIAALKNVGHANE